MGTGGCPGSLGRTCDGRSRMCAWAGWLECRGMVAGCGGGCLGAAISRREWAKGNGFGFAQSQHACCQLRAYGHGGFGGRAQLVMAVGSHVQMPRQQLIVELFGNVLDRATRRDEGDQAFFLGCAAIPFPAATAQGVAHFAVPVLAFEIFVIVLHGCELRKALVSVWAQDPK